MRKFFILLQKEIRELLTLQVILPLLITTILFTFIGNIMSKEQEKMSAPQQIGLINLDVHSESSEAFISELQNNNLEITLYETTDLETAISQAKTEGKLGLLIIPENFEKLLQTPQAQKIAFYSIIRSLSLTSNQGYQTVYSALSKANESISNNLLQEKIPETNPLNYKNPLLLDEYIIFGEKEAHASLNQIIGFLTQQTMFIPIILFFVIIFSSQMIATSIASEKENKTLETLLTTPVSRKLIVLSKMLGAGIIALLASIFYIFGFKTYMSGIIGDAAASSEISHIIQNLGLSFSFLDYLLLGLSLFMGILVALSISLILGAFAEDVKSVSGLLSPIMVLVMLPYFLTMFLDINSLSPFLKFFVHAIPFSHIFLASPELYLHNYSAVLFGILYQFVIFLIFVFIASWIFSTDKIITMKLNFSKKKNNSHL